jgi:hypothetical protein
VRVGGFDDFDFLVGRIAEFAGERIDLAARSLRMPSSFVSSRMISS